MAESKQLQMDQKPEMDPIESDVKSVEKGPVIDPRSLEDHSSKEIVASEDQVEALYQKLIRTIAEYHPSCDFTQVRKAYEMAKRAHKDQKRQSGEPYIIHPLNVAIILADLELDLETIIAGLLHDVVEDTDIRLDDIRKEFGDDVANLVDGVTKLKQLRYQTTDRQEIQAENYRKMFLAMAKDIRVILIKLADRLHNMRTLDYKSHEKQVEKARETLDIYAPVAERLGISKIKVELDDLCLKYLEPDIYESLSKQIHQKLSQREAQISVIVNDIKSKLDEMNIKATVYGRPKHFFSIYKKMVNKHKTLDQIYDLLAVRIIVDNVKDCYAALGVIHDMYIPMPGRFKDYIAMPKANMYQSLHTTLMGPNGTPFEVQIRTWEMHRTAEYGIAAHWKYKEGKTGEKDVSETAKMQWLQKILEWQKDLDDNQEFINILKDDLNVFQESVYCFTPQGKVITLPQGSTVIDFAYQIHSAVGNKMVGARVNNRLVPINYVLNNGEQVEIVTSQNSKGPSRDWMDIAQTTAAKNKINQWFKHEEKEENIQRGKDAIVRYIKAKGMPDPSKMLIPEWMDIVVRKYNFRDWDSLCAAVGYGGLREGQVVNRLYEEYQKKQQAQITQEEFIQKIQEKNQAAGQNPQSQHEKHKNKSAIVVKGLQDIAVHFSKCCSPVPGDEIIGYITRGRGVSIHRTDCPNILNLPEDERARLIDAEWDAKAVASGTFVSTMQVETIEKKGLLMEISSVISHQDINIHSMMVRRSKDNMSNVFTIGVEITDKQQLADLAVKIEQVPGVYKVSRL